MRRGYDSEHIDADGRSSAPMLSVRLVWEPRRGSCRTSCGSASSRCCRAGNAVSGIRAADRCRTGRCYAPASPFADRGYGIYRPADRGRTVGHPGAARSSPSPSRRPGPSPRHRHWHRHHQLRQSRNAGMGPGPSPAQPPLLLARPRRRTACDWRHVDPVGGRASVKIPGRSAGVAVALEIQCYPGQGGAFPAGVSLPFRWGTHLPLLAAKPAACRLAPLFGGPEPAAERIRVGASRACPP